MLFPVDEIGAFCAAQQRDFSIEGSVIEKISAVFCFYNTGILAAALPFIDRKFVPFGIQDRLRHGGKMQTVVADCQADAGGSCIFSLVILCAVKQVNAVVLYDGGRIKYILCFPAEFLFLNRAEKAGCCIGNQTGIGFGSLFKRAEHPGIFFCHWYVLLFIGKNRSQCEAFSRIVIFPQEL